MATAQYTALANVTLASSAATVTFSSINGTYRDLMLVINGGATSGDNARVQINGSTTGYSMMHMYGSGSSTASTFDTYDGVLLKYNGSITTALTYNAIAHFMDYSATDKQKAILVRTNTSENSVEAIANRWGNTAAITSLAIKTVSYSWAAGTTFALYGVK